MSKAYKVRVVVTKTMWVYPEDIEADLNDETDYIPVGNRELDEFTAIQYVKGTLVEELRNNPNRGSAEIISIYDSEKKELKTKRKYL